ncbi:tetratricopeptide repeat protein [Streptomyces sp. BPSDS2]|uniref:tetratricopeptide repeat protein n=1 Tax=Streptomyces sp. BPSDS2 TaxID=2571021 RepID=UPI0010C164BC|nr:tetratricopeptide repeat protein [Streptomyces sp. BPSDS2]
MTDRTDNHISGGVFFNAVVQGQSVTLTLPDRPDPALAGLPRQSPAFAGRDDQLEQIRKALAPKEPGGAAPAVVVSGLAGMGKTELMLQAAHRALREKGWFSGGVLFVDLHGHDAQERRVSPKRALGILLRALGVPPEHIPPGIEERTLIYRSALAALADAGRRVLVVLDDVPTTGKLHHLLPGDGSTATLISSRYSHSELDALSLTLRGLDIVEGREVLVEAVSRALPDDERVVTEADDADQLVSLCDGLPLALRILASLLVDVPTRPVSHLRKDLEDTHSRLSVLSREERAVTAAFDLSYRRLSPEQAKLLRLLSLHPGPDFSTEATAHLYGGTAHETHQLLLSLYRRHLIEPREPYDRWQQHSLIRLYSRKQLTSTNSDPWGEGLVRLLVHFYETANLACDTLFETADSHETSESRFVDRASALRWLDAERHTLTAAASWAHKAQDHLMCVSLAAPTSRFLAENHYPEDAGCVLAAGILSSRHLKDRFSEASFLSCLGVVLRDMRKLRKSVRAHRQAIKICRKLKDRRALASALNNLGLSLHELRKFEQAVAAHQEASTIYVHVGDRAGAAHALSNIGETLIEMGRPEEASRAFRKAMKAYRKQGNSRGYAQALGGLAKVTRHSGEAEKAVELHKKALEVADGLLIPHERAVEIANFATALTEAEEFDAALAAQQEALATFRHLGDRRGEAMTLGNMALVRQRQGKWNRAIRLHTLALEAFLESNDDHALACELTHLASALLQQGRNTEALENLELAAALYHRAGEPESAADTLDLAARVRRRAGVGLRPTGSQA